MTPILLHTLHILIAGKSCGMLTLSPSWSHSWWILIFGSIVLIFLLWRAHLCVKQRKRIREKAAQENLEIQTLKKTNELKSRFFSYISHEFRTPLTMIISPAEDLMQLLPGEPYQRKLKLIKSNSRYLLELVEQILELSKIDSQYRSLQLAFGDLVQEAQGIVSTFTSFARDKNVVVSFVAQPEIINTYFDRDIFTKVFNNLLSNAVKFTRPGGRIKVFLSRETNPDIKEGGQRIRLVVSDNGIGIPKKNLPFIFDRFAHASNTDKRPGEGFGLGLALVKELLKLHRGDITVESIEGQGSTFTVTCSDIYAQLKSGRDLELLSFVCEGQKAPISTPNTSMLKANVREVSVNNNVEHALPKVLLIEDNDSLRNYMAGMLCHDFIIFETNSGSEGLTKTHEIEPDIILCDVVLPDKNGFEVTTALKSDARTSHIPVILLTARVDESSFKTGMQIGADDYITKPFKSTDLILRMKNLVSQRTLLKKRYATSLSLRPHEITGKAADQQFLDKVLAVIEKRIDDENLNVSELAQELGLSSSQLARKLNALLDQTPVHVIRSVRLTRAAEMLKKNTYSVSEIAYQVGFKSPNYFARAFRQKYNCTPKEFIRTHKTE